MATFSWIVLFEDDDSKRKQLEKLIAKHAGDGFRVHAFDADKELKATGVYEDQLRAVFGASKFGRVGLFVTDRDLSKSKKSPGLSEAAVSKAAALLGVPVGVYSAGSTDSVLERQRSGGDGRIVLDSTDLDVMAKRVAALAKGFDELGRELAAATKAKSKQVGPGAIVARALKHPEVSAQIALYTSGDQRMIAELMPMNTRKTSPASKAVDRDHQRTVTALGTWLYDSVLRFPGVLLDQIAAASFLNIAPKRFGDDEVQRLFTSALYKGPFADKDAPRWWRHLLSDVLDKQQAADGRTYAAKVLGKSVGPCPCSVDNKSPAGFMCAVTLKPVCDEHSVGQVGWLPRGADLTRVTKSIYDELSPWIGVS